MVFLCKEIIYIGSQYDDYVSQKFSLGNLSESIVFLKKL